MDFWEKFSEEDRALIKRAVEVAELNTSGEIRVHIENRCKGNVFDVAANVFEKLEMHKTELRNGVLLYFAIKDRKFVVLGDAGINAKTGPGFFDQVKDTVLQNFKEEEFTEGLLKGIKMAGEKLRIYFPFNEGDRNELPNEISFGEDYDEEMV